MASSSSCTSANSSGGKVMYMWLIGNPTSGHGIGEGVISELAITMAHHVKTPVRHLTASQFLCSSSSGSSDGVHDVAMATHGETRKTSSGSEGAAKNERSSPAGPQMFLATHPLQFEESVYVTIISTERTGDGSRVAHSVAERATAGRLHAFTTTESSARDEQLHIVVTVGGDGTLSEVVNGLCTGTLSAYTAWCEASAQQRGAQQDENGRAAAAPLPHTATYSEKCYWQHLHDKSVLTHLLPALIYAPGGTGADFAKMRLCCGTGSEFLHVWRGAAAAFFTGSEGDYAGEKQRIGDIGERDGQSSSSTAAGCGAATGRQEDAFTAFEVDFGRILFPRTGRVHFFVNECSIGMSCDVVERSERLKTSRVMNALGGLIMYATAAFISLVLMTPKAIRMARLPRVPRLPSSSLKVAAQTVGGRRQQRLPEFLISTASALGLVNEDTRWKSELMHCAEQQRHGNDTCKERGGGALVREDYYNFYRETRLDSALTSGVPSPSPFYAQQGPNAMAEEWRNCREQDGAAIVLVEPAFIRPLLDDTSLTVAAPTMVGASSRATACVAEALTDDIAPSAQALRWVYFVSSTLAFGNGRWYGGGLHVTPHADPTDGLLSCTNWVTTFWSFVLGAFSLYSGDHVCWDSTTCVDGERFIVDTGHVSQDESVTNSSSSKSRSSNNNVSSSGPRGAPYSDITALMEADGELLEQLPAIVEVGGSITLLVPCRPEGYTFGEPAPGTTRARALFGSISRNELPYARNKGWVGYASRFMGACQRRVRAAERRVRAVLGFRPRRWQTRRQGQGGEAIDV